MAEPGQEPVPALTAGRAVLIGHLVVTLPVVLVIVVATAIGAAYNRALAGVIVGCVIGWGVWAVLVPRWRDWVAGTSAPLPRVQKLAQHTGLVWGQGSPFERTELRRSYGERGFESSVPIYQSLRDKILTLDPHEAGLAVRSGDRPSWGCVVETGLSIGTATLVCLCDGTTSLYTSSGFSIIGGGTHEAVVAATTKLLEVLDEHLSETTPSTDLALPAEDRTIIRALTGEGQRTFEGSVDELSAGRHVMSPVFEASQAVITQLRLLDEAGR